MCFVRTEHVCHRLTLEWNRPGLAWLAREEYDVQMVCPQTRGVRQHDLSAGDAKLGTGNWGLAVLKDGRLLARIDADSPEPVARGQGLLRRGNMQLAGNRNWTCLGSSPRASLELPRLLRCDEPKRLRRLGKRKAIAFRKRRPQGRSGVC